MSLEATRESWRSESVQVCGLFPQANLLRQGRKELPVPFIIDLNHNFIKKCFNGNKLFPA